MREQQEIKGLRGRLERDAQGKGYSMREAAARPVTTIYTERDVGDLWDQILKDLQDMEDWTDFG